MSIQQQNTDANNGSGSGSCLYDLLCADPSTSWNCHQRDGHTSSSGSKGRLKNLMCQSGNGICADCGSSDPKWVSLSLGVFICIKCSGVHRSLGVHISKVLSVNLDEWTDEQVDTLVDMGGNDAANLKFEACIPDNLRKPKPDSSIEERSDYIRRKYELHQFLHSDELLSCPYPYPGFCSSSSRCGNSCGSALDKKHSEKQTAGGHRIHGLGQAFRNSWRRKESEHKATKKSNSLAGMIEFVGLIKVNVVRGTNLAVRDIVTSDPYVILSLGHQSVKTRVIKNNLNPVWNEQLMLSIPQTIPPLKMLVYDKDTFKPDDFMGDAEIDIQPLVSAAKASEISSIREPMQLGSWVASKDNTLVRDGIITFVDGKVKQEISLRLQNVEKGTLDIELECVPLTQ
ncbi:probable ADP-ribosylation factor GTPase-activating protein AGD11 isoform X1 [Rhododendron vialii]|uniref:probable ADP-ribosylation factor GTPase-activating protein AGD11 isoform X1 n=1 Tax=Rhododendron vialii TaxID=182163 RepID=UPI00265D94ED|nr:probable ADP-ribosylation factor GTPase-activating protein AGD11 isoform X1 [Rhododendron vialii]